MLSLLFGSRFCSHQIFGFKRGAKIEVGNGEMCFLGLKKIGTVLVFQVTSDCYPLTNFNIKSNLHISLAPEHY